jgi:hypothetical protein
MMPKLVFEGRVLCSHDRLVVVERQLEAGEDEHAVRPPGAVSLSLDLREIERERGLFRPS